MYIFVCVYIHIHECGYIHVYMCMCISSLLLNEKYFDINLSLAPILIFFWHMKFLFHPNESVDLGICVSKGMRKLLWKKKIRSLYHDKLHGV